MTTELGRAPRPWMVPREAAQYVGIPRRSVERAIEIGILPAKWLRGERLIAAEDARAFRAMVIQLAREAVQ
jgi:excisionase family DNA binding protein